MWLTPFPLWISLLLTNALAMPVQKTLTYQRGLASYSLQRTESDIILRDAATTNRMQTYQIQVKPCNKKLVLGFWKDVEREFGQLPEVRGASLAKVSHVQIGKISRGLFDYSPAMRASGRFFDLLPQAFLQTLLKEQSQCGRSS